MEQTAKGFTLLELVVAISIISILAAVSFPMWSAWYYNAQYKGVALDIASVLRDSRSRAITTNQEYDLQFDVDNSHYWLSQGGSTVRDYGTVPTGVTIATGTDSNCSDTTGDGSAASDYTIQLYPNGTIGSSDTAQFFVCVMDANGKRRYLTRMLYHATGRVEILKRNSANTAWY